jgi:hypothetical protein
LSCESGRGDLGAQFRQALAGLTRGNAAARRATRAAVAATIAAASAGFSLSALVRTIW